MPQLSLCEGWKHRNEPCSGSRWQEADEAPVKAKGFRRHLFWRRNRAEARDRQPEGWRPIRSIGQARLGFKKPTKLSFLFSRVVFSIRARL